MQLIPMRACEECWETYKPHSGIQKFCSKKCSKENGDRKRIAKNKQSLIDGSGNSYYKIRFTVLRRDNFTCQYCGRGTQNGAILHIDHIRPKAKGGKLKLDNLITSCLECNEGKKDILLTEREQKTLKSKNKAL